MKRFLVACLIWLAFAAPARAGVSCTLPFTLTNNTLADATQVMANYNALITCLGSAAGAGANTDITSLAGLTSPLSVSQGGASTYIGGASTGSANSQIVASLTPGGFQLVNGFRVIFKAGFTNTGPTTVNANAQGATNVFRRTSDGIQALVGGEIIANALTEIVYDGTQFQLIAAISPLPVGTVLDTIASVADPGFVLMQGQCVSATTLIALWTKMGSPVPGGCAAGQFALPDGRGRVVAMIDSGGSGRITAGGGNFDGTILYGSGGQQNRTVGRGNLPNVDFMADGLNNVPTAGNINVPIFNGAAAGGGLSIQGAGTAANATLSGAAALTGPTISGHIYLNGNNPTPTALPTLQPTVLLNKQVKY